MIFYDINDLLEEEIDFDFEKPSCFEMLNAPWIISCALLEKLKHTLSTLCCEEIIKS